MPQSIFWPPVVWWQWIARKLLFTVGAHEGLKSGSETGRGGFAALCPPKGVAGKGGEENASRAPERQVGVALLGFIGAEMGGMA